MAFADCFLINTLGLLAVWMEGGGGGHKGEQVDVIWYISHCDKPGVHVHVFVCVRVRTHVCVSSTSVWVNVSRSDELDSKRKKKDGIFHPSPRLT